MTTFGEMHKWPPVFCNSAPLCSVPQKTPALAQDPPKLLVPDIAITPAGEIAQTALFLRPPLSPTHPVQQRSTGHYVVVQEKRYFTGLKPHHNDNRFTPFSLLWLPAETRRKARRCEHETQITQKEATQVAPDRAEGQVQFLPRRPFT